MGSNHDLKEDQCQTPELVPGNFGLKSAPVGFKQPRPGSLVRYGNIRTSLVFHGGLCVSVCVFARVCVCVCRTAAIHTTMWNGGLPAAAKHQDPGSHVFSLSMYVCMTVGAPHCCFTKQNRAL
ncbi:unnamed protein product [Lota lota]